MSHIILLVYIWCLNSVLILMLVFYFYYFCVSRIGGMENFFHCPKCSKSQSSLCFYHRLHVCALLRILLWNFIYLTMWWLCDTGCCHSVLLRNSHPCVEGAMHHDCPVCFEVWIAIKILFSCFSSFKPFLWCYNRMNWECLYAVSLWVDKWCNSHALWTHYS